MEGTDSKSKKCLRHRQKLELTSRGGRYSSVQMAAPAYRRGKSAHADRRRRRRFPVAPIARVSQPGQRPTWGGVSCESDFYNPSDTQCLIANLEVDHVMRSRFECSLRRHRRAHSVSSLCASVFSDTLISWFGTIRGGCDEALSETRPRHTGMRPLREPSSRRSEQKMSKFRSGVRIAAHHIVLTDTGGRRL